MYAFSTNINNKTKFKWMLTYIKREYKNGSDLRFEFRSLVQKIH